MTAARFVFLVVGEDGTSHEHHARLRTGSVDQVLRRAVGGWPEPLPISLPGLSAWCDEQGRLTGRRPNPVGSLLVARLGGPVTPLVGPIAVTGRRGAALTGLDAGQIDTLLAVLAGCR